MVKIKRARANEFQMKIFIFRERDSKVFSKVGTFFVFSKSNHSKAFHGSSLFYTFSSKSSHENVDNRTKNAKKHSSSSLLLSVSSQLNNSSERIKKKKNNTRHGRY